MHLRPWDWGRTGGAGRSSPSRASGLIRRQHSPNLRPPPESRTFGRLMEEATRVSCFIRPILPCAQTSLANTPIYIWNDTLTSQRDTQRRPCHIRRTEAPLFWRSPKLLSSAEAILAPSTERNRGTGPRGRGESPPRSGQRKPRSQSSFDVSRIARGRGPCLNSRLHTFKVSFTDARRLPRGGSLGVCSCVTGEASPVFEVAAAFARALRRLHSVSRVY
jgi:hypothetical protein